MSVFCEDIVYSVLCSLLYSLPLLPEARDIYLESLGCRWNTRVSQCILFISRCIPLYLDLKIHYSQRYSVSSLEIHEDTLFPWGYTCAPSGDGRNICILGVFSEQDICSCVSFRDHPQT